MRHLAILLAAAGAMHAAIIKGIIVENQTGKVLARTLVTLQPIPGSTGVSGSVRTDRYGSFAFLELPAGAYVIHATRRGFMPAQFGQKNWRAAGQPVVVEKEQSLFLNIRLARFASISGTVMDENDVGMAEHEVVAMSNTRPPRMLAKAQADDRGMYRISGLVPGSYLIRTIGRIYEDGAYVPTFYRETQRTEEAAPVEAILDAETSEIKVRPAPGKLYNIGGQVIVTPPVPMTITLVSDVGRETLTSTGAFQFYAKAAGPYEIWVEVIGGTRGAYVPVSLEHEMTDMKIAVFPMANLFFEFTNPQGSRLADTRGIKIQARRVDLAGEGETETLKMNGTSASVLQGRWQFMLAPAQGYVATDFRGPRGERPEGGRADGWNEVTITNSSSIRFVMSDKPASLTGAVTIGANDPAVGAPVYLEAYDETTRKRVVELRSTRTDVRGKYRFDGLVPGTYRVVSTFEYNAPATADIDTMRPKAVKLEEGREAQEDLEVFVIR